MSKQEQSPRDVDHFSEIREFIAKCEMEIMFEAGDVKYYVDDLEKKYNTMKREIEGLKEEVQMLEDSDPFENFEPIRDESRD